ncbi:MAG: DinB family protein [Thermomicrobiales bacterium]
MPDTTRQITLIPPDGADAAVGYWIAALEDGRRRTLEMLEDLEPALVDAKAPYHRHTIGTLLYHIALIEADWLYVEIQEREDYPDEAIEMFPHGVRDDQDNLTSIIGMSLDAHLERLAWVREQLTHTLTGLSAERFSGAREIPGATVSTAWVVHHLLQHEAEHRGEMGQILDALRRSQES